MNQQFFKKQVKAARRERDNALEELESLKKEIAKMKRAKSKHINEKKKLKK